MKITQDAVQLYTLRDHLKTADEYAKTLEKIAAIGYQSVQVSGPRPISATAIRELCAQYRLTINSTHEASDLILNNPAEVIENLRSFGCKYTAYPYPVGIDFNSMESVENLIARLAAAGKALREAGLVLTYHNHQHEFRKVDGETLLAKIYRKTPADDLQGEIDTYWVQFGGGDPAAWCRQLKNRLPLLHMKDYRIGEDNQPKFAEIGNGVLNFKEIVAAAEGSGCQWFIVEQDVCPGDPFVSLEQSFRYIWDNLVS